MSSAFTFAKVEEVSLQREENPLLAEASVRHVPGEGNSQAQQNFSTSVSAKPGKVPLEAGYSQMDWLRRVSKRTKSTGVVGRSNVTVREVKQHRTREDAWTILRGKVYNITPYLKYHPGGAEMLMKGAGKDCTALFTKYHAWVNADMLLKADFIGTLDPASVDSSPARTSR